MDMNKEKWINEVMNSLDDVKSAEANPFLYNKILSKINTVKEEPSSNKPVWLMAASFAILVALNFQAMRTSNSFSKNEKTDVEQIANAYNFINTNSINY